MYGEITPDLDFGSWTKSADLPPTRTCPCRTAAESSSVLDDMLTVKTVKDARTRTRLPAHWRRE